MNVNLQRQIKIAKRLLSFFESNVINRDPTRGKRKAPPKRGLKLRSYRFNQLPLNANAKLTVTLQVELSLLVPLKVITASNANGVSFERQRVERLAKFYHDVGIRRLFACISFSRERRIWHEDV